MSFSILCVDSNVVAEGTDVEQGCQRGQGKSANKQIKL